jgi:hypothetical protein
MFNVGDTVKIIDASHDISGLLRVGIVGRIAQTHPRIPAYQLDVPGHLDLNTTWIAGSRLEKVSKFDPNTFDGSLKQSVDWANTITDAGFISRLQFAKAVRTAYQAGRDSMPGTASQVNTGPRLVRNTYGDDVPALKSEIRKLKRDRELFLRRSNRYMNALNAILHRSAKAVSFLSKGEAALQDEKDAEKAQEKAARQNRVA